MYKLELHMHTAESSKCARATAEAMVEEYSSLGYNGVVITDHFLNGNTTVPSYLPWKKKVELFLSGYKNACIAGQRYGIDVFLGWEYCFKGMDLLTYGLNEDWLLDNSNVMFLTPRSYCDLVHQSGGTIVQAHPFRETAKAYDIEMIRLIPRKVDAVEAFNAHMSDFVNKMADMYADAYNLPKTVGSDNHAGYQKIMTSVNLTHKPKSSQEIALMIKNGEYETNIDRR